MISCQQALELISLELDGFLEEADRKALEEHLSRCASCRLLREDLSMLHQALPGLEYSPPTDFAQSVLKQMEPSPTRKRSYVRGLAGIAACALLCIGLWQLHPAADQNNLASASIQPQYESAEEAPPATHTTAATSPPTPPAPLERQSKSIPETEGEISAYAESDLMTKGRPVPDRRPILTTP